MTTADSASATDTSNPEQAVEAQLALAVLAARSDEAGVSAEAEELEEDLFATVTVARRSR